MILKTGHKETTFFNDKCNEPIKHGANHFRPNFSESDLAVKPHINKINYKLFFFYFPFTSEIPLKFDPQFLNPKKKKNFFVFAANLLFDLSNCVTNF